jgi:hypothetical protein
VLMPQIKDAARVFPSIRNRYVRWMERAVGMVSELFDARRTVASRSTVAN